MNRRFTTWGAAIFVAIGAAGGAHAQAVISNGTIKLGVNQAGALNVTSSAGAPNYSGVGVQYIPTGWDGTYAGCTCEGWGAGISGGTFDGVWGGQNTDYGAPTNLSNITFTSTATTATSSVTIRSGTTDVLRVTQEYLPSATPNLYQVNVTLTNLTGATLGVGPNGIRYRREMDWDIPTPGHEVVTLTGWGATNLLGTSSNGFIDSDPFSDPGVTCGAPQNANFTNIGPCDHGAVFDFGFPALAAGGSKTFTIFYGAAANLAGVRAALGVVGAEVASWAFCGVGESSFTGPCVGENGPTFVFGFQGVGGTVIVPPPPTTTTPEPATLALFATGLSSLGFGRMVRRVRKS